MTQALIILASAPILLIMAIIKIHYKGHPKETMLQVLMFYIGGFLISLLNLIF